jgi:hypothetical protein
MTARLTLSARALKKFAQFGVGVSKRPEGCVNNFCVAEDSGNSQCRLECLEHPLNLAGYL